MRRLIHQRRCDCLACFGFRLAVDFLAAGLGAVLLITFLVRPGQQQELLVAARVLLP